MQKLTCADLLSLERYSADRAALRAGVIAHKQHRRVALGPLVSLLFEDRRTVQHQVQEMLQIEKLFDAKAIQAELDAYNPLIPDGSNLKATMFLQFPDPLDRAASLARLGGIERQVYLQVAGAARSYAIADEDVERRSDGRTSAVHFLRFELPPGAIADFRAGAALSSGIDDPRLAVSVRLSDAACVALRADLLP